MPGDKPIVVLLLTELLKQNWWETKKDYNTQKRVMLLAKRIQHTKKEKRVMLLAKRMQHTKKEKRVLLLCHSLKMFHPGR